MSTHSSMFAAAQTPRPLAPFIPPSSESIYEDRREMAFAIDAASIGIAASAARPVFGMVLDMTISSGRATLVALADGTVNLYLGTGSAILGTGRDQEVAMNRSVYLDLANRVVSSAEPTADHPLPPRDMAAMYFLTHQGVRHFAARQEDFDTFRAQLSPVFHLGQELLSEIFRAYQRQHAQ